MTTFMRRVLPYFAFLVFLFALTPYAPLSTFFTDIPSHFMLQYAVISAAMFCLGLALNARWWGHVFAALALCVSLWQVWPYFPFLPDLDRGTPSFTVLQANVATFNEDTARFKQMIAEKKPDLIAVGENNTAFKAMFATLEEAYPYQKFGRKIALISRFPLEARAADLEPDFLIEDMDFAGKKITIATLHPETPLKDMLSRDREFGILSAWLEKERPPLLVFLGDINATQYCPALKKLEKAGGLLNARLGKGLGGSYPTWLPPFMRLPIDHVYASSGLYVQSYAMESNIGSDHLPSLVKIAVK